MSGEKRFKNWTITDEKKYIDGKGTWTETPIIKSYRQLLKEYIVLLEQRDIKPAWVPEALAYARAKLKEL